MKGKSTIRQAKDNTIRILAILATIVLLLTTASLVNNVIHGHKHPGLIINPEFREPTALRSENKILEVSLTAEQSTAKLNTVAKPVEGMLLYSWSLLQGDSDGDRSGEHQYPGPTLIVNPGDRLILHVNNELQGLTIPDLADPALTPTNEEVPLTPRIVNSMPLNMHTHGLHVSPNLNSDNVMIEFMPGQANTYTYNIPADHPEGIYWYHPHRHQYTEQQVYRGLAGMLVIGHAEGNIPKVRKHEIPVRLMALQSNFVANRAGGQNQLTYPAWTQMINTWEIPRKGTIASGTYQPVAAPVNFPQSAAGTTFKTNWFTGQLTAENKRGAFQFMPQNLINFRSRGTKNSDPINTSLPDYLRDYQFTVNGQFQPQLKIAPGQTEIWVIGNYGSQAYMNIGIRNTASGKLLPLRVVATDGNVASSVLTGNNQDGTTYLLPSSSRVAIAVTMPQSGGLQLELPPVAGANAQHTQPLMTEGILYKNDGDGNGPKGVVGNVSIRPSDVNWFDGFKSTPTQVLARATAQGPATTAVDFAIGEPLVNTSEFLNLSKFKPDLTRTFTIGGGSSPLVNPKDPNGFMYMFDGTTWPTTPSIQARINSIEEWKIYNTNNDQHPIHIHVNDFEVSKLIDPVQQTISGPQPYRVDNYNVPAPSLGPNETVIEQGQMWLRSTFKDFLGTFVMHCHRLDHEDNGLMMTVNVIPEISTIAIAETKSGTKTASVVIRDQENGRVLGRVIPFPGSESLPSIAMADIDGDTVLDLIAGQGPGGSPEVVVYSGSGAKPFTTELARFNAFESSFKGGVSVTGGLISGDPTKNSIIVGSGPGRTTEIKVFSSQLPTQIGKAPDTLSTFSPADGSGGVVISSGLVTPSRISILAAPNEVDRIKIFQFPLFTKTHGFPEVETSSQGIGQPVLITDLDAFENYEGPISLATGWIASQEGGVASIITGQRSGDGMVRVFSWASNLNGQSPMYVESSHHQHAMTFASTLTFTPFKAPVSVATTSTTAGADLVVAGKEGDRYVAKVYSGVRSSKVPTQLTAQPRRTLLQSKRELSIAGA